MFGTCPTLVSVGTFDTLCDPNGPQQRVLWGNLAPFAAANLITGHWADDVYALAKPGGSEQVVRPAIEPGRYLTGAIYEGHRSHPRWPEKLMAKLNDARIRMRGQKGGMFFVDRRKVYSDQIRGRLERGEDHDYRSPV